ncbi:MAG: pseudouridine-5'-phosphate glycosidase [Actinomycetota bacterium]|nr:pseudouridine-5'-phosphate glycosidase [Actinomycetota bacterium]
MRESLLEVSTEVAAALADHHPVVALESTLISHGLPWPDNLETARRLHATVRAGGAVPATVGVVAGRLVVGLSDQEVEHLARAHGVAKLGLRDLAPALAQLRDGATTVASTAVTARRAGIDVFATGGVGGVHRGASTTWDESADLAVLADTPLTVVCSGVKSILDVAATLERLESLSVAVVGFRTDRFPGFYLTDSGHPVGWRADSATEIAAIMRARAGLQLGQGALLIANPVPPEQQLDPDLHDRVLAQALAAADAAGIAGKDVTPYLLAYFHRATGGLSLQVNVTILLANAGLAADIAVAAAG